VDVLVAIVQRHADAAASDMENPMNPDVSPTSSAHQNHELPPSPIAVGEGAPAKPLLGVLPLARLIPQDVHSVMDYADGVAVVAAMALASEDDGAARIASVVLGASAIGVALTTDYRLGAVKLIPIETHEAIDHLWGLSAIAAPFVLGYWKTSPRTAIAHISVGAGTILTSLVTDYRSWRRNRVASR
jgi:hypothetical protein